MRAISLPAVRRSFVAVAVVAALAVGACSLTDKESGAMSEDKVVQLEEQMRGWPSLEATEQQVTAALRQIADAATAIDPALQWRELYERSQGTCKGVYANTDGVSAHTSILASDTPISDAAWPQVLTEARRISTTIGIDQIEVRVDQPGHHDVRLFSGTWSQIQLGSHNRATLVGDTGCRFTEAQLNPPSL